MIEVGMSRKGELTITSDGTLIAHVWLPEKDRLILVTEILKSLKKNPAAMGRVS
jgi:hypothetical protein